MLNVGTSPLSVRYDNDRRQAPLTLGLLVPASIILCALTVACVLAM